MRDKEQWVRKKLGDSDVSKIIMGQSPSSSAYNEEGVGLPFLQGCAEFGDVYPNTSIFCSDLLKIAPKNSILMSVRAPVGAINKADQKYVIGRGLCSIVPMIDGGYLYYYLLQNTHKLELKAQGSTFLAINSTELNDMPICYPDSLPAQRRIAAILSAADKVIEQTRQLIGKYKSIKQGMMEDLLKPKEGWKKVKFGEYVTLQGGFAFQSKDFVEEGVPLIRIGDITSKGLCIDDAVQLPICFLEDYEEYALHEDDTVIAMSGATTGKCTIVLQKDLPALLNQRVGRFVIKNNSIDKTFLYYIVGSYTYQQKLLLDAIGGAQPNVSPKQIESVLCYIPVLADGTPNILEQRRIAKILSEIDRKIEAEEKVLEKYEKMKKGLMERMLKEQ